MRAVLDMKSSEQHKLQTEVRCCGLRLPRLRPPFMALLLLQLSLKGDLVVELRELRDQLVSLQQKNEDLESQVHEKSAKERFERHWIFVFAT